MQAWPLPWRFLNHCAYDVLAWALRLWSKMRSSASASSKISSAWLIHPPRLATPHAQIFYLRPRSGSICCANARDLGSYISLSALTHVLPSLPCKPDFHSCSTVWILFASPAQALGSLPGAWHSSLATRGTLGTVLFLSMVPLRAPELKYSVPLVFAMWSSEALVLVDPQDLTVLFPRCCLMFLVWCCVVPPSLFPLNICPRCEVHGEGDRRCVDSDFQGHV